MDIVSEDMTEILKESTDETRFGEAQSELRRDEMYAAVEECKSDRRIESRIECFSGCTGVNNPGFKLN